MHLKHCFAIDKPLRILESSSFGPDDTGSARLKRRPSVSISSSRMPSKNGDRHSWTE